MRDQIPLILPLPRQQPHNPGSLADPREREEWRGLLWLVELPLRLKAWRRALGARRTRAHAQAQDQPKARAQAQCAARSDSKAYARTPFFSR